MEEEISSNLGVAVIGVEITDSGLDVQKVIDDVRTAVEFFCCGDVTVNIFDVRDGKFKVTLEPLYLAYQIGTIANNLRDAVGGILVVVVDRFAGDSDTNDVGSSGDDELTVIDRESLTRDWEKDFDEFQKQLEKGVIVESPSFKFDDEGEKDS